MKCLKAGPHRHRWDVGEMKLEWSEDDVKRKLVNVRAKSVDVLFG